MASITTDSLLRDLLQACHRSPFVRFVEVRVVDDDVLSVRAHLLEPNTFINVFYNVATEKTAFALVKLEKRIFGADNARMGWHKHPLANPDQHETCAPVSFNEFLAEVEGFYRAKVSQQEEDDTKA